MLVILEREVEAYRRKRFLESANQAYAVLRKDTQAWKDEQTERRAWDVMLDDGL